MGKQMNARLSLAVAVVAGGPLVVGCNGSGKGSPSKVIIYGCNISCPDLFTSAIFILSCDGADLTNVAVSGPCATGDGTIPYSLDSADPTTLYVGSTSTGVCHVELTFGTAFTYSTDVTFSLSTQTGSCCPGPYIAPTQATFTVKNPSTTCVDAGNDAGADVPTDGPSEDATCPQDVPCGCSCPKGDDGGVCVCQNFSVPVCPSNASASASCNQSGSCMGCSEGAGFECFCRDAGVSGTDGGGPQWLCGGTEYACTGGIP
jgi:hypothetical protein